MRRSEPLAERPAGQEPDPEQSGQRAHLAEQEPPPERHEADADPRLPLPDPQREVDERGAEQQDGKEHRDEDERDDLERDPPYAPPEPRPRRAVVGEQGPLGGHPHSHGAILWW